VYFTPIIMEYGLIGSTFNSFKFQFGIFKFHFSVIK